jgi:hypothetical protein
VEIERIAVSPVEHGDDDRLAVDDESDVGEVLGVEDLVDRSAS